MVKEENYNEIVSELVSSMIEEGVVTKEDKIICITNGHSPIAFELEDLGYDAKEVSIKKFDGICDVLITKISDTDNVKLMNITDVKTKLYVMYNRLFTGETAQKIAKFSTGNVGTSVNIQENGRSEPFDNRIFCYNFGGA